MTNPTTALNAVRIHIRDGAPPGVDPFNMVRLEDLSDQIPEVPTPIQTVFQVRFDKVPTQQYMNVNVIAGTLVAYVDGVWAPTQPTVDVDVNGNFTLSVPPVSRLLITYAWRYVSDGEINQFLDEARMWLREFASVSTVPDGLGHALISYASYRALAALGNTASRLARTHAGESEVDWSALAKSWRTQARDAYSDAKCEREAYYTQGPEALDPTAADVSSIRIDPYEPLR